MQINSFKQSLLRGNMQYGLWNVITDTNVGEICASAGFDWVLIDGEHGPFDLRTTLYQHQAMSAHASALLVRVPDSNTTYIRQLLDAGIQNLLVPMVESARQAQSLVQAMRYPPEGNRGVGTAIIRGARWGIDNDYNPKANEQVFLAVQIETVKGLENLEEIAAVKGVDCLFIGPADLATSMGHANQPDHPEVNEAITDAFRRIKAMGKVAGVLVLDDDTAKNYARAGATMVGVGADIISLSAAVRKMAAHYRKEK